MNTLEWMFNHPSGSSYNGRYMFTGSAPYSQEGNSDYKLDFYSDGTTAYWAIFKSGIKLIRQNCDDASNGGPFSYSLGTNCGCYWNVAGGSAVAFGIRGTDVVHQDKCGPTNAPNLVPTVMPDTQISPLQRLFLQQCHQQQLCQSTPGSTCPDLDVSIAFTGGSNLKGQFGKYSLGYQAMLEILRDWTQTLSLTGEDHTVGISSIVRGGVLRMAFVQFARTDSYWICSNSGQGCDARVSGCNQPIPSNTCTNGRLSGKLDELIADFDWHKDNYMSSVTYLASALEDVVYIFKESPPHRQKLLIIMTSSALNPAEPQMSTEIPATRAKLDALNVVSFGIVIREGASHTQTDIDAESMLTPFTDGFANVPLDGLMELLQGFCDASTSLGLFIRGMHTSSAPAGSPPTLVPPTLVPPTVPPTTAVPVPAGTPIPTLDRRTLAPPTMPQATQVPVPAGTPIPTLDRRTLAPPTMPQSTQVPVPAGTPIPTLDRRTLAPPTMPQSTQVPVPAGTPIPTLDRRTLAPPTMPQATQVPVPAGTPIPTLDRRTLAPPTMPQSTQVPVPAGTPIPTLDRRTLAPPTMPQATTVPLPGGTQVPVVPGNSPIPTSQGSTPIPTVTLSTLVPTVPGSTPLPTVIASTPEPTVPGSTPTPAVPGSSPVPTVLASTPAPTIPGITPLPTMFGSSPVPSVIASTPSPTVPGSTPIPTSTVPSNSSTSLPTSMVTELPTGSVTPSPVTPINATAVPVGVNMTPAPSVSNISSDTPTVSTPVPDTDSPAGTTTTPVPNTGSPLVVSNATSPAGNLSSAGDFVPEGNGDSGLGIVLAVSLGGGILLSVAVLLGVMYKRRTNSYDWGNPDFSIEDVMIDSPHMEEELGSTLGDGDTVDDVLY
eukprot:TRINITY_DN1619_c0_g1_i5.p1 TRINITY_DN1619_c0_g1~~TRINITY_DN1619_c0_g1_i5.p1  ORF type:complete len:883 (+),score=147.13 TRINITY_DN1619_c0_g1_i5:1877-4525(+)